MKDAEPVESNQSLNAENNVTYGLIDLYRFLPYIQKQHDAMPLQSRDKGTLIDTQNHKKISYRSFLQFFIMTHHFTDNNR